MNTTSSQQNGERLLEIGWFVVDELDAHNRELIALARERVLASVTEIFPQFDWRLSIVTRILPSRHDPAEASLLWNL